MNRAALCLHLFTFALTAGCYSYTPADLNSLQSAARVRARVSATEVDRLRLDNFMLGDLRTLEGRVIGTEMDSLRLMVSMISPYDRTAFGEREVDRRLVISRSGILELERKKMDRTKTGIAVAVGVSAFTLIAVKTFTGWFSSDATQGNPPVDGDFPETSVVPLIRMSRH
jgi:hypothetical protein